MGSNLTVSNKMLVSSIIGIGIVLISFYFSVNKQQTQGEPTEVSQSESQTSNSSTIDLNAIKPNNQPKEASIGEENKNTKDSSSQTATLTRNLLGAYLQELQNGTYTPESKSRIVQEATNYVLTVDFTPYTREVLTISPITNTSAVRIYKNALQEIMQPLFDIQEYELTTYARAVQNNSKKDFDKLAVIVELYKTAGERAKELPVPKDAADIHLNIVNSLIKFSVILNELAKGYDDPAASLSGVANFTKVEEQFGKAFDNLKTYFILKKVYNTNI